jgi:hypothetical protein
LYRFYSIISKWHRFQSLLKYREYFSSAIWVSDRFFYGTGSAQGFLHLGFRPILFKKWFYFDICIGFIPVFSNGNYISLVWELYIDRFFMVLVVYKGSYISVSDRFLFKKTVLFRYMYRFYTGFFQWELYIFGMGLIYLWYGNYI